MNRHPLEIIVGATLLLAIVALLLFTWNEGHELTHLGG